MVAKLIEHNRTQTVQGLPASDVVTVEQGGTSMTDYVIRGGELGKARLRVLAQALWPTTRHLLNSAGLSAGQVCLDVGCGGGDVTLELARVVGSAGSVTGIDIDSTKLALAQQEAADEGITNVEFRVLGVDQLGDETQYDLVYARFLLTHLRDPAAALHRMMKATKPGGVVIVEDLYHGDIIRYPACPALDQHVSLYNQVVRLRGADPEIGPKLPALFRQVGLHKLQLSHVQPAFLEGAGKQIHRITLENVAPAVIAAGLATEAEIKVLCAELDHFAQNPHTIMSLPRVFQVWGYRD